MDASTPPEFHLIAFEGPDPYSRAGGLATRVAGLSESLAANYDTHLWFIGSPDLPGHEVRGRLRLHRWCQWISRYHECGTYDGEDEKVSDLAASLPPFLLEEVLRPTCGRGQQRAVVLAEEWQTVDAVVHLDRLLRRAGLRDRVTIVWNANNTFGFERIDWLQLHRAALITTVSRYMRQQMWSLGIDPVVVPNGLPPEAFVPPGRSAVMEVRQKTSGRMLLAKVARWDPDKRWLLAVDTVAELKRTGLKPLLVARGGMEHYGATVLGYASSRGLRVVERPFSTLRDFLDSLAGVDAVDVVVLTSPLTADIRATLFRAADAVLANSEHEPFGLVGLEAMAAGGLACIGGSGEDYASPGWNCLLLQSNDPREFLSLFEPLHGQAAEARAIRRRGRATADCYRWIDVVRRNLVPRLSYAATAPRGTLQWRSQDLPQREADGNITRDAVPTKPMNPRPSLSPMV